MYQYSSETPKSVANQLIAKLRVPVRSLLTTLDQPSFHHGNHDFIHLMK